MDGQVVQETKEELKSGKKLAFYREALAELDPASRSATRYRIKEWKPIYTKIMVLVQKGMTVHQIAQEAEIGYTVRQLMQIIKDPLFRLKISQQNKKMDMAIIERATEEMTRFPEVEIAKNKLAESSEKAADILVKLLNPRSSVYRRNNIVERKFLASIAMDILNRAGLKNSVTTEETAKGREYSPDEIRSALDNAKELEQIANRLDNRESSFVLTGQHRNGAEEGTISESGAYEPDTTSIKTNEESEGNEQSEGCEEASRSEAEGATE